MNVFRRVNRFTSLRQIGKSTVPVAPRRYMGGGGGNNEPHVPEFHDKLGKFCLTMTFLWIFYRAKENRGQLFVSVVSRFVLMFHFPPILNHSTELNFHCLPQ